MSTRTKRLLLGVGAAALALGIGATAIANRKGQMRDRFMRHMVDARIEDALDEITATPDQRALVEKQKERVFGAMKEMHQSRKSDLDAALGVFAADRLDDAKIKTLRDAHQAEMQKIGDVVVQAVSEVHKTLSPQQRKQLVEYVRNARAAH